jgi:DNA polymerase III alpha subunit
VGNTRWKIVCEALMYLDIKTDFSFLRAYGSPDQVTARAKDIGATWLGIADYEAAWGHVPFWTACKKVGIKPIFGVTLNIVKTLDKTPTYDIVTVLAKNDEGLRDQYAMISKSTEQFYYRPRLTWEQLSAATKHNVVIATRVTPGSRLCLEQLKYPCYIGVGIEQGFTSSLAGEFPSTLAVGPLYPTIGDAEAYRLVNAIGSGQRTGGISPSPRYMMTAQELKGELDELGFDASELMASADAIAEQCGAAPSIGKNVKPRVKITIEQWCKREAKKKGIDLKKAPYAERYAREIKLIYEKGFNDYFLMIADIIEWAKARMFVGPARGSSAGSFVAYLMGIVEVDPLKHDLLFERFIDVNRSDLPDVDIDFPDERRDMVFDYIIDKYGKEHVARIGTVSVFKPKSALNDTAKCYNIPPWEVDKLTEVMVERSGGDARANMAIMDTIEQFEVGKDLIKKFPKLSMATKIEGHPRHTGQHAAGVIIADRPVDHFMAINRRDGGYIAQINKDDAEKIGLMKIDALGLKTLSVIQDCCDQVGIDPRSLYTLELDYEPAYDIFKRDKVAGIFQFEGYAVRSLMRQMGVDGFNDIVALTALARPGPLHGGGAMVYVARKRGDSDWDYDIPQMEPVTNETYGTIVYQEQVMRLCREIGQFSWKDTSIIRKTMSKTMGEEFFNQFEEKFADGAATLGIDRGKARSLWKTMCTFGSWGFNKSHAVSYALVSYWCAYLKSKYPLEFAVAHLRRTPSADHVLRLLRELKDEGYEIVPFDHNVSDKSWGIHDGKIYGGFESVRGVGPKSADECIAARQANPDKWPFNLRQALRQRILGPDNTPWHNLDRLHKKFAGLYDDPDNYRSKTLPHGVSGPVVDLIKIEEKKGSYCFIGTLKQRNLRDLNETQSLARRGGKREVRNELFLNLTFEDDTSSILATVNRWRYPELGKPLMESNVDDKDFIVRGSIRQDGWRKIDIESIRMLEDEEQDQHGPLPETDEDQRQVNSTGQLRQGNDAAGSADGPGATGPDKASVAGHRSRKPRTKSKVN